MRYSALTVLGGLIVVLLAGEAHAQTALQELEKAVRTANQQGQLPGGPARDSSPAPAPIDAVPTKPGYLGLLANDQAGAAGVRIVELSVGAPGEKAGLRSGDLVTAINGRAINSMRDFEPVMLGTQAGATLTFQIQRDGQPQQVVVVLGERPEAAERRPAIGPLPNNSGPVPNPGAITLEPRTAVLGVRLATVTPEVQRAYTLPARGALVVDLVPGSPADKAGIPVEAVIVFVDGKQIDTPSDLSRLVAEAGPGKEIKLAYFSRGQLAERRVLLEGLPVGPMLMPQLTSESDRVQTLERRIIELERRIAELEQALNKQP